MSEISQLNTSEFNSNDYLESIRASWRNEILDYRGRRDSDQSAIAEILSDEAEVFIDQAGRFFTEYTPQDAQSGLTLDEKITDVFGEDYTKKYREMKEAFQQAYVAIGIATQRAERDHKRDTNGKRIVSLFDLPNDDRVSVMQSLFSDFQDINTLRFGAVGSGVEKSYFTGQYDANGNEVFLKQDADLVPKGKLWGSILNTNYTDDFGERTLVHTSAKHSPADHTNLRASYPDKQKRDVDHALNSARDPEAILAKISDRR